MTNAVFTRPDQPAARPNKRVTVGVILAAWLAVVLFFAAGGAFARPPGTPPLPLLAGVAIPLIVFFVAFRTSHSFRDYLMSVDLRLVTAIQAWRFAGFGFLALYVHDILPGVFAWPAGLGDMATAAAAPWIMLSLTRHPGFAASRPFRVWNLLAMLDLVVAVSIGALDSSLASGVPGEITTGPMARLPLILIPAFFVPCFLMLHITALYQARKRW